MEQAQFNLRSLAYGYMVLTLAALATWNKHLKEAVRTVLFKDEMIYIGIYRKGHIATLTTFADRSLR